MIGNQLTDYSTSSGGNGNLYFIHLIQYEGFESNDRWYWFWSSIFDAVDFVDFGISSTSIDLTDEGLQRR